MKGEKSSFVERFRAGMSVAEPLRRWSSSRTGLAQPQPVLAQEEGGGAPRDGKQASAPALLEAVSALDRTGGAASVAAWREPAVDPPPGSAAPARDGGLSTERGRDLISSGAHLVGSISERGRAAVRGARREARLKVAIVLMTRRPHRFDFWLAYHRSLGVSHFFVLRPGRPEPDAHPNPTLTLTLTLILSLSLTLSLTLSLSLPPNPTPRSTLRTRRRCSRS